MSVDRFNALERRLSALKRGEAPRLGLLRRMTRWWSTPSVSARWEPLRQLDAELERAGVHTIADARLLRDVGARHGRLTALRAGLQERSQAALQLFEAAIDEAELAAAKGPLNDAQRTQLDDDFRRLGRVVKVAAVFRGGEHVEFETFTAPLDAQRPPVSARLAVAEFYATRAKQELGDTHRRKHDLDLAHELLLRMGAEAKGDRARSRRLRVELGSARGRARGVPGVRSLDELVRHVRHTARIDPSTAWKSIRALYERASEAGETELAKAAFEALSTFATTEQLGAAAEREVQLEVLGTGAPKHKLQDEWADRLTKLALGLEDGQRKALELANGCERYFDIEDALAEERPEAAVGNSRPTLRRVSYPTQQMVVEPTSSLDRLADFILERPGSLVLELASGRQLARSYLEEAPKTKPKRRRRGAIKVYVLDASGSMHGARAQFRDALLIAELNAIRVKAAAGLPFDPLYFIHFNDTPSAMVRVDDGDEANRQLAKLVQASPAFGQTDISLALVSAFDSIGRASGVDPSLSRATVVLVTDGEDGVDQERVRRARRAHDGVDVAMSFISLGEENPDLRSLVLDQRSAGRRAFYHHLSDDEIRLAPTTFDSAWRTLVPSHVEIDAGVLDRLSPHLDALQAIAERRPLPVIEAATSQFDALFPERRASLPLGAQDLERLVDVMEAVGEAVAFAPLEDRRREAIALLTHLLQLYGMTIGTYLSIAPAKDPRLDKAVARVRLVC